MEPEGPLPHLKGPITDLHLKPRVPCPHLPPYLLQVRYNTLHGASGSNWTRCNLCHPGYLTGSDDVGAYEEPQWQWLRGL